MKLKKPTITGKNRQEIKVIKKLKLNCTFPTCKNKTNSFVNCIPYCHQHYNEKKEENIRKLKGGYKQSKWLKNVMMNI